MPRNAASRRANARTSGFRMIGFRIRAAGRRSAPAAFEVTLLSGTAIMS